MKRGGKNKNQIRCYVRRGDLVIVYTYTVERAVCIYTSYLEHAIV